MQKIKSHIRHNNRWRYTNRTLARGLYCGVAPVMASSNDVVYWGWFAASMCRAEHSTHISYAIDKVCRHRHL